MWAASVAVFFAAAVACHAALCRIPLVGNMIAKFLLAGGLSGLALSVRMLWLHGLGVETWTALLLYACAAELYVFVCALVTSSVSISLLLTLRQKTLTPGEIDRLFTSVSMVEERLQWLLANRLLERRPPGYAVTRTGRTLVATFRMLRGFFRLECSVAAADRGTG